LVENIEDFLTRGGRLVVAFYPLNAKPFAPPQDSDESDPDKPKETKEKKKAKPGDTSRTNSVSLRQQWGVEFGFDFLESGQGDSYEPVIVLNKTEFPLPGMIEWHSSIIFTNLDSKWRTVYARGTNAVVIERRYGRGSIVMATDSYFLSNEALWKERHPALLTWLVGPNRSIVFDESHFGIMEGGGVAILMRKYRLHGLIGGFVLLAALFVWKNSLSLVQPYDDEQQGKFVTGKGTAAGFVNLLRRNIPATNVLNTCGNEWKKSYPQKTAHAAARVQQVQAVLDAENSKSGRDRDPIGAYQQICRILKRSNSCLNKEPRMDTNEHE
jgi:hypothetical protein